MPEAQNLQNHSRALPAFYVVAGCLLLVNLAWSLIRLVRTPSADSVIACGTATALGFTLWYLRVFPLTVQDRVIRLEERLRLARLLPVELQPSIEHFTRAQLIGMRFASDDELPGLARKVLEEHIEDRSAIKRLIRSWRPDQLRA
ncbi:MAG: DUF6526 family protein [Gemmatimonadota bacterium]